MLFVRLTDGVELTDELNATIKKRLRDYCSPRHVPSRIVAVADLPRTRSGKLAELAVADVVHGRPVRNSEALANPGVARVVCEPPNSAGLAGVWDGNCTSDACAWHDKLRVVTQTTVMPTPQRGNIDRRFVPGDGWEARVPRILSWICYGVAAISFITAIFPGQTSLGWLRSAVDLFFLAAPPT